ncbi:MAG TPA: hypothetical protein VI138_00350 [Candidatus Dormibacteraeota bacterium]
MSDGPSREVATKSPPAPMPPRITQTERATWVVYAVVAVLLLAVPLLTHSFSLPVLFAWLLLIATVAMAAVWHRQGTIRGPEWIRPEDYDAFLKKIQQPPTPAPEKPAPPRPPARLAGRGRSDGPPAPP